MGGMFEAGDVQLSRLLCVDRVDNKPYCLLSLSVELVEQMLPGIDHSDFVPICQMRDELKNKYKVDHVDEQLTPDDVEEMYVGHELHRALEELCGDVQFPVLPTSKYTLFTAYYTIHDVIICS